MKKILFALALATVLLTSCSEKQEYRIVGYLPAFRGDIVLDDYWWDMTHLNLSFVTVNPDGSLNDERVRKTFEQVKDLAKERNIKLMASIGGGGGKAVQDCFAAAVVNPESRKALAENLAKLAADLPLAGIDLDYEAWNYSDEYLAAITPGFEDLVVQLRALLGKKKLLTAAVATYGHYTKTMFDNMDYFTVMCYDLHGPWSAEGGPHSPFEYFVEGIEMCQKIGAPNYKIVPGVPFYGYGFPEGKTEHAYSKTYGRIVDEVPGAENLDCVNDEFFYDGMPTMARKCRYVKENGLGGIMFWQLAGDSRDPQKSLLKLINRELNGE